MEITAKMNAISKIVDTMYEYQIENNVKQQCAYNCYVLFTLIKHNCPEFKPKVIQIWAIADRGNDTFGLASRHLVIGFDCHQLRDHYIDPSYEFKDADLFGSFKDFRNAFSVQFPTERIKEFLEGAIEFQQYAKQITEGRGFKKNPYCSDLIDFINRKSSNNCGK